MNTALPHALEQVLEETRAFMTRESFDLPLWEAYCARRAVLFAQLQTLTFPAEGAEHEAVSALIHEILACDALLIEKARTQLAALRTELATLTTSRRALNGYVSLPSASLFQRDI
jgi:hypothetical protein